MAEQPKELLQRLYRSIFQVVPRKARNAQKTLERRHRAAEIGDAAYRICSQTLREWAGEIRHEGDGP